MPEISLRVRAVGALLRMAWEEYERDHARYLAAAMVYYALVSFLPFLLLVLAVIGLLLRFSAFAASLEQQVLATVEGTFGAPLRTTLEQLLSQVERESLVATAISVIGLLVTASTLFGNLRLSFRALWKHEPPLMSGSLIGSLRASVLEKTIAYVSVLLGGASLLIAFGLIAGVQWATGLFSGVPLLDTAAGATVTVASPAIVVGVTFALLFLVLPPVRLQWRDVQLATVLCTIAWIVVTEIMLMVGTVAGKSRSAPGAFGGLLAVMLWINVVAQMLFYGAELCKVVHTQATSAAPHSPT